MRDWPHIDPHGLLALWLRRAPLAEVLAFLEQRAAAQLPGGRCCIRLHQETDEQRGLALEGLAWPIRSHTGQVVGSITVASELPGTATDVANLLESLAGLAGLAYDVHLLPIALAERQRMVALATTISQIYSSPLALPHMLQQSAEALVDQLDMAFARIWLLDETKESLVLAASAGLSINLHGSYSRIPVATSLKIGFIARTRQPLLTNNVQEETWVRDRGWAKAHGLVSYAGYPLVVEDRVVGVMAMFARHPLEPQTLDALQTVAGGMAQAIVRSQADEQRRRTVEALAERIKELEVLHHLACLLQVNDDIPVLLPKVVALLPTAMQYPELAAARVVLGAREYLSPGFRRTPWEHHVEFRLAEGSLVRVDLVYLDAPSSQASGSPFLPEEVRLIQSILEVLRTHLERKVAEDALREHRGYLRAIVETAADGIVTISERGIIQSVNPATERLFGYSAPELVGQPVTVLMPSQYREAHARAFFEAKADLPSSTRIALQEFEGLRKDGSVFPLELSVSEMRLQDGRRLFTGILRDITARQRADRQRQQLAAIVESSSDAIISSTLDDTILTWNRAAERMYGYSAAEAIGQPMSVLIPPERLDEEQALFARVRHGERIDTLETERRRKDGRRVPIALTMSPIKDDRGAIVGVSRIAHDITERRQAEEALRDSEERFRLMFELAAVGKVVADPHTGRLLRVNQKFCELTGYSNDELLQKSFADITHQEDRERDLEGLRRLRTGEQTEYSTEKRYVRKDGATVWTHLSATMVRDSHGRSLFTVGVIQDISERKRAEAALRVLNETLEFKVRERTDALLGKQEALRALAAELSRTEERQRKALAMELHDNLAQILALAKLRLEAMAPAHEVTSEPASEVKGLINEALGYTRSLISDLRPPVFGDADDLQAAVSWVVRKLQKRGLQVRVQDDGERKVLDEEVLTVTYQALQELLFNVLKHAGTSEAVIYLNRTGSYLEAVVLDEGVGFEVAEKLRTRLDGGFGLLNIRERVKSVGGDLEVVSSEGAGTCATVRVPLKTTTAAPLVLHHLPSEAVSEPVEQPTHPRPVRVVLVDDHRILREGLRSIIDKHGDLQVVAEASSGAQAVELVRTLRPDVVLMDFNMPGMNGAEATRLIKAEFSQIPVVALSMEEEERARAAMREAGATAYFSKGESFEQLARLIHTVLGRN